MALDAGFSDEGPVPSKFAGLDPCHAIYALAENVASLMSASISELREAKGFVRIVGNAEDEYMPSGPPMSPLTVSYFTMWALFDVRFGSSRESMGSCILRIGPEFNCPSWLIDTVEQMQQSKVGFVAHYLIPATSAAKTGTRVIGPDGPVGPSTEPPVQRPENGEDNLAK